MTANQFGHSRISRLDGSTPESWFAYTCAHCGKQVSGAVLALIGTSAGRHIRWLQCSICHDASVQADDGNIYPGAAYGPVLEGLPASVGDAYEEARRCLSVNAHTAAEGLCRKILMHVAVDKGAAEGDTFVKYIDHLSSLGYVTPPMKEWVNLIKRHGNESNHLLEAPSRERAEGTLYFTAQLLRNVYEMEHLAAKFTAPPKPKP